jgi:hypothetical protein
LQLLGNTTMKIEEVAAHLAYTDAGGFVRAFRRWQGCSPSEYRWDLCDPMFSLRYTGFDGIGRNLAGCQRICGFQGIGSESGNFKLRRLIARWTK